MENATNYTQVKVPLIYDDGVPLDIRSRPDDLSPLKSNSDGGGGGDADNSSTKSHIISAKRVATFGTWNVSTLYAAGAAAVLVKELERLRWHVIGLAETHWTGAQEYWVQGYKIINSGRENEHRAGVGLILSKLAQPKDL